MSGAIAARHWPGDPARPALALHCSMGSSSYWGPVAERLGGVVDLYAIDAPGHGRSGPPAADGGDYHLQVTAAARAHLPGAPVDLIGHSLGGTVALRLAVEMPARVRSLTLIEPVMFAAVPDFAADPLFPQVDALLAEGRDTEAARLFLTRWGEADPATLPDATWARMVAQIRLVSEVNHILVHDRAGILRPGGLERITAPAMLIRGADSPAVVGQIARALLARLPHGAERVVAGAAHMLPITHPDAVAAAVAENLARG